MKLHFGATERPGLLRFVVDGYWLKLHGEPARLNRYATPRNQDRALRSLWGISGRTWFVGFMKLGEPSEK